MNVFTRLRRWLTGAGQQRIQTFARREAAPTTTVILPAQEVEVFRDGNGEIQNVRIGSWRVLGATVTRRIAEVKRLWSCQRVAVRVELRRENSPAAKCTIWELYDVGGFLQAILQSVDEEHWMVTRFRPRNQIRRQLSSCLSYSA